ncbi:MAG TPA: response regulator [Candidatus Omnitrophota bacterium]|nr:response regulator [Candidatus Omnitrophota bacterium]HNQ51061.1 response regulator [Candidatus Omnitrophota bacterium]HQO37921.1 response regulator [Candidatus Omnitrophota bacterium]HQQ06685.1 response regulator [Candidatus Omnitrophota bacterium]
MAEKKKILFIDDEEAFVTMVKMNLEEAGPYEVRTETRGTRALAAIQEFNPDMVFLDVIMPDISGSDVLTEIKDHVQAHKIPVVFLTAIITEQDVEGASAVIGGREFLAKPISTESLIACIKQHLG